MLKSLNQPVAKIIMIHTGRRDAKKADFDMAKDLKVQLLLAKDSRVILIVNLWIKKRLVNGSMEIVKDIIYKEHGPPSLPIAIFIKFKTYNRPTITSLEKDKVVLIL